MPELSGPQIVSRQPYKKGLKIADAAKFRLMRKDPVLNLVRNMFFAGIYSGNWIFEVAADGTPEMVDYIQRQLEPVRLTLLSKGALGCFDFGWAPFEKVIDPDPATSEYKLMKLKPLVVDSTEVVQDEVTGALLNLKVGDVELEVEKVLVLNFDQEGSDVKGQSQLEFSEPTYDAKQALQDAASRYDTKVAGAHWLIKYPNGTTPYNGVETENSVIAKSLLKALQSSGAIAIPLGKANFQQVDTYTQAEGGWTVELITAQGVAVDFNSRFDYYDKSLCRALGFPERSILEGQNGTKAEAEAHGDFVITLIEYRHACLLEMINWHLVNHLLRLQFGEGTDNKVVVKAAPLADSKRAMLRAIYDKILANGDGLINELDALDMPAMREALDLPVANDGVDSTGAGQAGQAGQAGLGVAV